MQQSKVLPLHPAGISNQYLKPIQYADLKICIHLEHTIEVVPLHSILYIAADSNYCKVHLVGGKTIFHAKTLGNYDKELEGHGFLRVHQSYLLNLRKVVSIDKHQGVIKLTDGTCIPYSKSRKAALISCFQSLFTIK